VKRKPHPYLRVQSLQELDEEEVKSRHAELTSHRDWRGRLNSFSPPYSSHSQWAVALAVLFIGGVVGASNLPPKPPHVLTMQVWSGLIAIWSPLLAWLLLFDPRARASTAAGCLGKVVRCNHGCVFTPAPKTKHCRRCDKCVDGFDHHCLWLNTCVGARNYRPWISFVAVLFVWALLSSCISVSALARSVHVRSRRLAVGHRPFVLATSLATAAAAAWLLVLLGLHAYFAVQGITTLEWAKGAHEGQQHCGRSHLRYILVPLNCSSGSQLPSAPSSGQADQRFDNVVNGKHGIQASPKQSPKPSSRRFLLRRRISLSSVATVEDTTSEEDHSDFKTRALSEP